MNDLSLHKMVIIEFEMNEAMSRAFYNREKYIWLTTAIRKKVFTEYPHNHIVDVFIQEQSPMHIRPIVSVKLKPFTEAEIFTDRMEFFISNIETIKP